MAKLGEVCSIKSGYAFKSKLFVDVGIPIIRIGDIADFKVKLDDVVYYPNDLWNELEPYAIHKGDILIAMSGATVGKVGVYCSNKKALLNQRVGNIVSDCKKTINEYILYFCQSQHFTEYIFESAFGCAQPNISIEQIKNCELEIPCLDVQYERVKKLANIDFLINAKKTQVKKLDLLVKSRFIEMFGDETNIVKMADICSIITDGTHQPPKFVSRGIPFLFVSNIANNEINYNAEKFINIETYAELYKRTPIELGDIILSTVGSYGHPAIVKNDKKFLFQRHIAYLKPKKEIINSVFLHAAILSETVQEQIKRKVKGIAQKTLNLSNIRSLDIILPDINKQKQFAEFIYATDKSKLAIQQSLEKLETLKKSLMQEYFG